MTLVELAPQHKTGLALNHAVLTAAGCWGFADEYAGLVDFSSLGAFVTNPVTWRSRRPARQQQALPIPGGVLIHTGLPNPGLRHLCDEYAGRWSRLPCPVILHLAVTSIEETDRAVQYCERLDVFAGVELGFRDEEEAQSVRYAIEAAVAGMLPVIVRVPFRRATEFAMLAEQAGAAALTVAAPPRGTLPDPDGTHTLRGRIYGAALFPQMLPVLAEIRVVTSLPIVAVGGIHTPAQARACLTAGAIAVQIDSLVWTTPEEIPAICEAVLA